MIVSSSQYMSDVQSVKKSCVSVKKRLTLIANLMQFDLNIVWKHARIILKDRRKQRLSYMIIMRIICSNLLQQQIFPRIPAINVLFLRWFRDSIQSTVSGEKNRRRGVIIILSRRKLFQIQQDAFREHSRACSLDVKNASSRRS